MLWVGGKRAPRDVIDAGNTKLRLAGFTNPSELDQNVTDQGADKLGLSAFGNPSRESRTTTENTPVNRLALSGFIPAVPFNRTQNETQPVNRLALASFGNPSRDSRTPNASDIGAPTDALKMSGFNANLESETTAWIAAVIANSGTVSGSTILAQNQWVKAIKAAGIRSKILRWNNICGDAFGSSNSSTNLGAVQVPIIADKGGSLDVSSQAQNQWTYAERGAGGGLKYSNGGSHPYLDTGFVCATDYSADTNAGFCCYMTVNAGGATWSMGVQDGSGNNAGLVGPDFTAVGTRGDIWKPGTAISDSGGKGFYHVTKGGSGDVLIYKTGSLFQTTTNPGGNRVLTSHFVYYGINITGTPTALSNGTYAAFGLLADMSSTEALALYNATQAFQTALTRQV